MAEIGFFKYVYYANCSKPKHERTLYRSVKKKNTTRIVELGVGDLTRAQRLIQVAQKFSPATEISYTGIDMFEARSDHEPKISLKQAHTSLTATGAKIRLIPGNPFVGLSRFANTLVETDLLYISFGLDEQALDQSWFYMPRMLHSETNVFQENKKGNAISLKRLSLKDVMQAADSKHRAAA